MSQQKVDKYKQEKAQRDKLIKKEKRILAIEKTAGILVVCAIIAWFGYSAYGQVKASQDAKVTETVMDATAIDNYLTDLQSLEDAE